MTQFINSVIKTFFLMNGTIFELCSSDEITQTFRFTLVFLPQKSNLEVLFFFPFFPFKWLLKMSLFSSGLTGTLEGNEVKFFDSSGKGLLQSLSLAKTL